MKGDSATPIPPAVMDSARGGEFRAFLDRSGKPSPLTSTGTSPAAAQVQGLLSDFFPWVRAGFKVGEAWADTSVNTTGAGSRHRHRPPSHQLQGGGERDPGHGEGGEDHRRSHLEGRRQSADPAGRGADRRHRQWARAAYFVSPDGRYLGGEWELHSALQLSGCVRQEPGADHGHPDDKGHGGPMRRRMTSFGALRRWFLPRLQLLHLRRSRRAPLRNRSTPTRRRRPKADAARRSRTVRSRAPATGWSIATASCCSIPAARARPRCASRVAFVRLTLADAPTKGAYKVTLTLDSLEALESGTPVPPDSVAAARGRSGAERSPTSARCRSFRPTGRAR